jgi:transcriptional regulator with XRE-family HTH domain
MNTKLIARLIREVRESLGLTQGDIADFSKKWNEEHPENPLTVTSRTRYAQLETEFNDMTVGVLTTVCTFLDKEPEELGIQFNLNNTKRPKPGSKYIVVEPGTPQYLVTAIQEILRLANIGIKAEKPARDALDAIRNQQREEASKNNSSEI